MVYDIKTWLVMPILLYTIIGDLQYCIYGESQVPGMFIFGDSTCDCGNNNLLSTLAKSNFEPYGIDFPKGPTGRFTNGRTISDIITQFLGFDEFIPPFANIIGSDILKGVNYASGGAGIRIETNKYLGSIISLGLQIENHKLIVYQIARILGSLEKAQQYLNKCLYYISIGRNDYIHNYFLPQLYPTSHIYSPQQYAVALNEELALNLLALHEIGARKYVLVGLGLLGCTPYSKITHATNGSCVEEENAHVFIFNDKLKSLVDKFNKKFSYDSKFIFINGTSQDLESSHGFSVLDTPCCPSLIGACIPHHRPCYNRSEYKYWDQLHLTEAWNLFAARTSFNPSNPSLFTYPMDIKHLIDQHINQDGIRVHK